MEMNSEQSRLINPKQPDPLTVLLQHPQLQKKQQLEPIQILQKEFKVIILEEGFLNLATVWVHEKMWALDLQGQQITVQLV